MRSLIKVAQEKGWVKEETITKTASSTTDLSPTSSITENILKLCSGLRQSGLEKHAVELEDKLFAYKQAQTLYEAHKETGEDLVDQAHPKGSHKLEDVDSSEAVFETIVDKHIKMVQMIDKKPTGKLASSKEILDAVKVALGARPLASGRANSSRKIAQEQTPASSGLGTDIAATVGTMGGLSLLKFVYNRLKASSALDRQTIKYVEEALARKLTNAEAKAITEKVVERAGKEAMEKAFGQSAKAVTEKVVEQAAAKAVGEKVVETGAEEVAKKVVPGAASSVAPWLAGQLGASSVGTLGGVSLTGLSGALFSVPTLIGAVVGGAIGYELFEHYFKVDNLKGAGDRVISEVNDLANDWPTDDKGAFGNFKKSFSQAVSLYPIIETMKNDLSPENIEKNLATLGKLNDAIYSSRKYVQSIWSIAQSKKEESFFRVFGGWASVVAVAANYMEVATKINNVIDTWAQQANELAAKKSSEINKADGGSSQLIQLYNNAIKQVSAWNTIVKAKVSNKILNKTDPSVADVLKWLNNADTQLNAEFSKFKDVAPDQKPLVAKYYLETFNKNFKPFLDAAKNSKILQ